MEWDDGGLAYTRTMAGLIRRADLDELRARINIADVVGDYVTLKGAGVGSLKGLCPFHDERSPSFHVRPQVGRYHCFGCGEDGDVFASCRRWTTSTFTEAVERMAARIGFELHYEDGGAGERRPRQPGPAARRQPGRRGVLRRAARRAGRRRPAARSSASAGSTPRRPSGSASASPRRLGRAQQTPAGARFTDDELLAAGLLAPGDRGPTTGSAAGWSGRSATSPARPSASARAGSSTTTKGPKYLNTPETAVYHKSQVLYGLDLAKRDISRGRQVVVVEGYTDVMACHLAGVTTAVATCGTAFGVDHIKVIRRVLGDVERGLDRSARSSSPSTRMRRGRRPRQPRVRRGAAFRRADLRRDRAGGARPVRSAPDRGDEAVRARWSTRRSRCSSS